MEKTSAFFFGLVLWFASIAHAEHLGGIKTAPAWHIDASAVTQADGFIRFIPGAADSVNASAARATDCTFGNDIGNGKGGIITNGVTSFVSGPDASAGFDPTYCIFIVYGERLTAGIAPSPAVVFCGNAGLSFYYGQAVGGNNFRSSGGTMSADPPAFKQWEGLKVVRIRYHAGKLGVKINGDAEHVRADVTGNSGFRKRILGNLGGRGGRLWFAGAICEYADYEDLSDADADAVDAALLSKWKIPNITTIFDGDSIPAISANSPFPETTVAGVGSMLAPVFNIAVPGATAAGVDSGFAAAAGPLIVPGKTIYCESCGTNDIGYNSMATAAQVYASKKSIWAKGRAAGAKVVASTIYDQRAGGLTVPQNAAGFTAMADAVNVLIRSDPTLYDGLADYGSARGIRLVDGVHPDDASSRLLSTGYYIPAFQVVVGLFDKAPLAGRGR